MELKNKISLVQIKRKGNKHIGLIRQLYSIVCTPLHEMCLEQACIFGVYGVNLIHTLHVFY